MVFNGIDRIDRYEALFRGRHIGLITSPSGLAANFESTVSVLHRRFGLSALYSPEHGVRGNMGAGAAVDTYEDPYIHVPVYSLYRSDSKRLTDKMLAGVDLVVYDMQDVGARYYTFIATMLYAMEDCASRGIDFVVLDRLDPLGGEIVEGNLPEKEYESFIGAYPLCNRYALTPGEFARMADDRLGLCCKLHIVPVSGWKRKMLFPETGRVWVMPTSGIPRFETALLYPGTCFFEGTNLSEGRGTSTPFEIVGAPFVDAEALAGAMNAKGLPGVRFRPLYFTPLADAFKGEQCAGVQIHITDARRVRAVETGLSLLFELRERYPDKFHAEAPENGRSTLDLLAGGGEPRLGRLPLEELLGRYVRDSAEFSRIKAEYHLYT